MFPISEESNGAILPILSSTSLIDLAITDRASEIFPNASTCPFFKSLSLSYMSRIKSNCLSIKSNCSFIRLFEFVALVAISTILFHPNLLRQPQIQPRENGTIVPKDEVPRQPPNTSGVYPFFGSPRQGGLPFAVSGTKKRGASPSVFGVIPGTKKANEGGATP